MPENQSPATQPDSGDTPGEFDFAKPVTENPRIKRRSLKTPSDHPLRPSGGTPPAARELEREAPPLSAEQAIPTEPSIVGTAGAEEESAPPVSKPIAPIRTIRTAMPSPKPASTPAAASTPTTSPHGTRPATLYYSSYPRKAETPSPPKSTPMANPVTSSSSTPLSSATRPATSPSRPATPIDYRANMERQSREQKSVGNILAYAVYALIGFFVISAGLAGYGSYVIFQRLNDQSATVSQLDARYSEANKDLNTRLAATQDTLNQAQAQITRQQELILKQQDAINRLIAATNDNANAFKAEKQARTQETAALRARLRDVELRATTTQRY